MTAPCRNTTKTNPVPDGRVALVVGVLFIMDRLHQAAKLQDCVTSGRTNYPRIEAPARQ